MWRDKKKKLYIIKLWIMSRNLTKKGTIKFIWKNDCYWFILLYSATDNSFHQTIYLYILIKLIISINTAFKTYFQRGNKPNHID